MDYVVRTTDQLAQYLKAFRQTRGESQTIAGERIGWSQASYSAMERRPDKMAVERLMLVLSNLGVELVMRERPNSNAPAGDNSTPDW